MCRASIALLFLVACAGCANSRTLDDAGRETDDGGHAEDTGATGDDAESMDANDHDLGGLPDLGDANDAGPGIDLGFRLDGGPREDDAGVEIDAGRPDLGEPLDAGSPDLGEPLDAGSPDLGGPLDAGSPDLGAAPDAGSDAGRADSGGRYDGCTAAIDDTVDATIRITTDNFDTLYVNGVLIDATRTSWPSPRTYTVPIYVNPAHANVIAIDALNESVIDGRDRGTILDLTATIGGTSAVLVTDASWLVTETLETGWSDVVHDESAWTPATDEGPNGEAPWGAILGTSAAHWLWAYDSNLPAAMKTGVDEDAYFRRTFYVDASGAISAVPGRCP